MLEKDDWMSGFLGKPSFHLRYESPLSIHELNKKLDDLSLPFFADAKASVNDFTSIHALEATGFRLIDTNLQFSAETDRIPYIPAPPSYTIRWAVPDDEPAVGDLGGRCIERSRFHLDPQIPNEIANALKADWVRNFFRGERGDRLALAFSDGRPVGFLQIFLKEKIWVIDLIGLLPEFRGSGAGSALVSFAARELEGRNLALVGTQAVNDGSVRFYEKLGFRYQRAHYVFHLHKE